MSCAADLHWYEAQADREDRARDAAEAWDRLVDEHADRLRPECRVTPVEGGWEAQHRDGEVWLPVTDNVLESEAEARTDLEQWIRCEAAHRAWYDSPDLAPEDFDC